jgi:hypothetical protein
LTIRAVDAGPRSQVRPAKIEERSLIGPFRIGQPVNGGRAGWERVRDARAIDLLARHPGIASRPVRGITATIHLQRPLTITLDTC